MRLTIHAAFLLLLPIIVAAFGLSVWSALGLVLIALAWRWMIVLAEFVKPAKQPELVLETISISHFVEKVRWSLDRLGVEYVEEPWGGTLGAFYRGRTVPVLKFRAGMSRSAIGNSAEILRYLWGTYSETGKADFLRPTAERVALEKRLDRYGQNIQVWVYSHVLDHRDLTLKAWGVGSPDVPAWQRRLLPVLYPVQAFLMRRSFRLNRSHYERVVHHIEELLAELDLKLADGRASILGDDDVNYTDLAFAALSGVWLQPEGYGGGRAEHVRIDRDVMPAPMREDIQRWTEDYPRVAAFVTKLYAEQRLDADNDTDNADGD